MAYLPGLTHDQMIESRGWSQAELVSFLSALYLLIGVYGILIMIALRNILVVIVKQKEYKNLPILMFYLFALIAVTLREVKIIWQYKSNPYINYTLDLVQQFTKLGIGLVQDWITLELAIRIHCTKGS